VQYLACAVKRSNGADGLQMKIEINMTDVDFERLWVNSMAWDGQGWEAQADRFDPKPNFTWRYAYWFDDYASLKMAEGFIWPRLSATHSDEAGGWVLLTNYASPCHRSNDLVSA